MITYPIHLGRMYFAIMIANHPNKWSTSLPSSISNTSFTVFGFRRNEGLFTGEQDDRVKRGKMLKMGWKGEIKRGIG